MSAAHKVGGMVEGDGGMVECDRNGTATLHLPAPRLSPWLVQLAWVSSL